MAVWTFRVLSRLALHCPPFARLLSTPRPLPIQRHAASTTASDLIVLLPGIGDRAGRFEEQGFVEHVRSSGWVADVWLVDAHYGYYADRSILDQLHRDVLGPARAAGYRRIWLAGISLGGFGALLYARRYGDDLAGVVCIAPYLGDATLIREIVVEGGLSTWRGASVADEDAIVDLWRWLQRRAGRPEEEPAVYLACGRADSFAEGHRLLASALPPERVLVTDGGHRWSVWQRLWKEFVRRHRPRDISHEAG